jgi:Ca2+/Na+ antiporter
MQVKPLSLPVHDLLDIVTGLILMLAPTAVHLSTSAQIASVLLGATLTGAGLGLTALRSTSPVAHSRFDIAFLLAAALAALILALAGQFEAVLLLSAAVTLQALLGFNTRYASAPSKRGHERAKGGTAPGFAAVASPAPSQT